MCATFEGGSKSDCLRFFFLAPRPLRGPAILSECRSLQLCLVCSPLTPDMRLYKACSKIKDKRTTNEGLKNL